MSRSVPSAGKALLLIAMGLFLYSRIANATIYFYINERFIVYTFAAALVLVLVGMSYPLRTKQAGHATNGVDQQCDHHGHHHGHEHGHEHRHTLSWIAVLVLALPIVLGMLVSPKPLGVAALENRELDVTGSELPRAVRPVHDAVASERNLLEWWQAFQASPNAGSLVGQDAEVTGFVYHDERFGEGHFVVTRYVVSCCVADATVVGMVVRWPDAEALQDDQWVSVRGKIAEAAEKEQDLPILAAEAVDLVAAPQQPYLYP